MVLEVQITTAIAKFFKGKREDVINVIKFQQHTNSVDPKSILYKNAASIAFAQLQDLVFHFMMRENGGKMMKLSLNKLTLSDFRETTKMEHSKEILFSLQPSQSSNQEETQIDPTDYKEYEPPVELQTFEDSEEEEEKKQKLHQQKHSSRDPNFHQKQVEPQNIHFHSQEQPDAQPLLNQHDVFLQIPVGIDQPEAQRAPQEEFNIPLGQSSHRQQPSQRERNLETTQQQGTPNANTSQKPNKPPPKTWWSRFKNSLSSCICCRKRQKKSQQRSSKQKKQPDLNPQDQQRPQNLLENLQKLISYPPEPIFERRWINYRLNQALPITLESNQNDFEMHFIENINADVLFLMKTRPDGEKLIKIKVQNKNVVLLVDFLAEVVQYFRVPYNGSDVQRYQRQPVFNNFPPMVIEIEASNVWALILGDLADVKKPSLAINLDAFYSQTWQGDSWMGPGICVKNIEAYLKKLYIVDTTQLIKPKENQQQPSQGHHHQSLPCAPPHHQHNRSLLEPFKVSLRMAYSVDFWRKCLNFSQKPPQFQYYSTAEGIPVSEYYKDYIVERRPYQSKNEWTVSLINKVKLTNNFSLSIRDIAQIQLIAGKISEASYVPNELYKMTRKEPPAYDFDDDCLNIKKILIPSLNIQILKNKDGVKVAQFELKTLQLRDRSDKEKQRMKLLATIRLDYFNKRKLDFEPFIEPWMFKVVMSNQEEQPPENKSITRNAKKIKISNFIEQELRGDEVPYYLKDHTNSLNFNITPALIEVAMEALKIYKSQMQDEEPYKIFNRCGYNVQIKDIKKESALFTIMDNSDKVLSSQQELWNKETRRQKVDQSQMLLNLIILKKSVEINDERMIEEEPEIPRQNAGSPSQILRKTIQENSSQLQSQHFFQSSNVQKQNQTMSTIFSKDKSKAFAGKYQKPDNVSNYKMLKYVNFDFVGKKFYPLERQHKNDQQEKLNKQKKGTMDVLKSNIDKITDAILLTNTKKINEERNIYIQVSVNINPRNGSKEILIQSTAKMYNYLDYPIEMGFLVNGQMIESLKVLLNPKQIFIVPMEFLENKTEVRFTNRQDSSKVEQIDWKYYQLDQLLCDQLSYSDFDADKDNSIVEVLEQAKEYVTAMPYQTNPVIKSEFKFIQDPLHYKSDFVITESKNASNSKFYFIINCVKVKNEITHQKNAYLNFAGIQQQKSEEESDICYETFLVFFPVFKLVNATVRDLGFTYSVMSNQNKQQNALIPVQNPLQPEKDFASIDLDYSDEIFLLFSFVPKDSNRSEIEAQTKPIKIFQKRLGFGEDNKVSVEFKQEGSNNLYMMLQMKKRSAKSRELVLYCPYLIFNETDKLLYFREYGLTHDIVSQDRQYYQHLGKNPLKSKKKDYETHSQYHNLHMFSTSTNMKKMQVAIGDLKDSLGDSKQLQTRTSWSNPVPLQNSNIVEIIGNSDIFKRETEQMRTNPAKFKKNSVKGKFEFGMKVTSAPGIFYRSKLITITPRFIVHNETSNPIVMAQCETEYHEINLLRLKPGDWKYFYWSNIKKPYYAMISLYQQSTGLIAGWSGFFQLQVQEISLKIPSPRSSINQQETHQLYIVQKVNITIMDDLVLLIRFIQEEPVIPPYYIENLTKYEITFKQQSSSSYKYKAYQPNPLMPNGEINRGAHQVIQYPSQLGTRVGQEIETIQFSAGGTEITLLQPGERVAFTWDNWIDEKEHVLEVEIEGKSEPYEIDKIQNFKPFILPGQQSKKKKANKKFLYKQGFIQVKDLDHFRKYYCTLNVIKQKFNVYTEDKRSHESYYLQGAKVDESKDNEFVLKINPEKMLAKVIHIQTNTVEEANEWVDYLWRAILIDKPEMVELKIEPSNQAKMVTLYQNKSNQQQKSLEEIPTDNSKQNLVSYKISISNCIGISIIDESPKEILQICLKNVQAEYLKIDESVKDVGAKQFSDDEDFQALTFMQDRTLVMKQIKEYINLQIDLMIINNQLLNSQFPVLMAPNKKKIFGNQQPFFVLSVYRKDQAMVPRKGNQANSASQANNQSTQAQTTNMNQTTNNQQQIQQSNQFQSKSKISYIHTLQMFTDTLEIRLDHQILDQIIQYYNQIAAVLWDSNSADDEKNKILQFNFRSLQTKLDQQLLSIKEHSISKIYIKNLMLEPIDICFTLKSSPGHVMNSSTNNVITDLGLTLASIDSAKIKLNAFKTQHIFGSSNEIFGRISKHYQGQFLTQIYKLLGSFELFGSPVSLISNLGTGVIDMFYEPFYALVTGKSGYKAGEKFFTGAVTLIHTSITGVYKTVNKILGAIMRILDQITLDKKYMSERANRLNRTIKNFKEGIIIGFTNFGKIMFQTLFGVLERPITGIREGGALGFLLGIYQGIMGIIIKPAVGIYDLLITIIEGIKNTAVYEEHIMDTRYRPPRIFGEYNQLIPFDFKHAIGTDIIRRFKLKSYESEGILFFDQLNISAQSKFRKKTEAQIVLTDIRIVYVLSHSSIHCDKIMIYKIKSIRYEDKRKQLVFRFHTPVRKNWYQSNSRRYYLKYENQGKAKRLLEVMQNSFKDKQYNIEYK